MTEDDSMGAGKPCDPDDPRAQTTTPAPDPEFPHIPYPIIRPAVGSPYYVHPRTGRAACLSRPGTPPLTSEDVRRELEDFP
jgi:hypothetical protein